MLKPILGIFGGMGPEATVDFYREIIRLTPAVKDQDHIPTLIYSLPQVPDRTQSILHRDLSIVPYVVEGVQRLERAGASFISIPCNTVHFYYNEMIEEVSIPILHIAQEAVKEILTEHPGLRKIGLLATEGTIRSGIYENALREHGFDVIVPDPTVETEKVMKAVYGIKAGADKKISAELLSDAGRHVVEKGAELIVLGCTEIPLAFEKGRMSVPVVNATEVLAKSAIRMYVELTRCNDTVG